MKIRFLLSRCLLECFTLLFLAVNTDENVISTSSPEKTIPETSTLDLVYHVILTSLVAESTSEYSDKSTEELTLHSTEIPKFNSTEHFSASTIEADNYTIGVTTVPSVNESGHSTIDNSSQSINTASDLIMTILKETTTQNGYTSTTDETVLETTANSTINSKNTSHETNEFNETHNTHDLLKQENPKIKKKHKIEKLKQNSYVNKNFTNKNDTIDGITDIKENNDEPECYLALANITKANKSKDGLLIGIEIPVCNEDGSFSSKQCSPTGYCRCVSKNGQPITKPKQGELFCECFRQRFDNNTNGSGNMPECEENGYFKPKQCMDNSTLCWCTSKEGVILSEPFEEVTDCSENKLKKVVHVTTTEIENNEIPKIVK